MGLRHRLAVLLFLLLPITSLAAGMEGQAEIAFAAGLVAYQEQDYVGAQLYFDRAALLNPQHKSAGFFRGLSAYQRGHYAEALPDLARAAAANPQDAEPQLYQGLCHYQLNQKEQALPFLQRAYDLAPPGDTRNQARHYITELGGTVPAEQDEHAKDWFFFANLSTVYDSNISLDPENLTLTTLPSDQDDVQISMQVGGGYHIIDGPQYRFTIAGSYYQALYPDLNQFNFGLARIEFRNQWVWGDFFFYVPVAYEFSLLATSKYLQRAELAPVFGYWAADRFLTRLRVRARYNDFFQSASSAPQDRDAINVEAELAEYFYFDERKRYFKVAYAFERNWAQGGDWDYLAHTIRGAFYSPIAWKVDTYLFAAYTLDRNFDSVDSVLGARRDDNHQFYGIRLSRPLIDGLSLSLHYSFRRNRSNLAVFQYNKHIVGVTFAFRI